MSRTHAFSFGELKQAIEQPGLRKLWWIALFLAVIGAGVLFMAWAVHRADREKRNDLLAQARLAASAVNLHRLRALTGTRDDLDSPHYLRLKQQLDRIKQAKHNCRFIYLMGRRPDGRVFFYVDNEPVGSEDEAPAGMIYEEISPEYLQAFRTQSPLAVGPVTDRWGTWITALVPVTDPRTGQFVAMLGMDVDARDWRAEVLAQAALPAAAMLCLLILLAAVLLVTIKRRQLEEANRRLQELDRMKSAFLSSVSHELRTPLTSIYGFAKIIHKDFQRAFAPLADTDKGRRKAERILENLAIIENEGERLTRLINDVLDLNKIESGRIQWRDQPLRPEALARQAAGAVQGQFRRKPALNLQTDIDENLPDIHADQDRILQVLINLLSNAVKFTPNGEVRLSIRAPGPGRVLFEIADTGVGVPRKELNRIFHKFHQAEIPDTLGERPQGTGLGLSICRQIVDHYGGRIWAESAPGQGSRFFVDLPARGSGEPAQDDSASEDDSGEPGGDRG
jgi:signal transduction histidine kinase